jgi:glycosyltransferase involved in cell wall biosynthesis
MGLKTVFKLSDAFDFLSPMISRRIEAKGLKLKRHKVNVAPNSFIDFDRILIEKKDPKRIAFSGRMEKIKNPILALEAVKILQKRGVDFELFLLGRGTLEEEIKQFIEKNELSDKVHFYFEPNIERILANSSIYLSLQDINNYPSQALLEAMASECAIIATNVEETSWLVDGEVGFLVGKNPLDIAGKLQALISNHELSLKLGQKARERAINKHNVKNYCEYLQALYNKVLNVLE